MVSFYLLLRLVHDVLWSQQHKNKQIKEFSNTLKRPPVSKIMVMNWSSFIIVQTSFVLGESSLLIIYRIDLTPHRKVGITTSFAIYRQDLSPRKKS